MCSTVRAYQYDYSQFVFLLVVLNKILSAAVTFFCCCKNGIYYIHVENPSGFKGRVTEILENGELERRTKLEINTSDSAVMLCGNHNMITDMQTL